MAYATIDPSNAVTESLLCKVYGKTRSTITNWKREGMPTDSMESANAWVLVNKAKHTSKRNGGLDKEQWGKSDWEIEKLRLSCGKIQREEQEAAGKLHDKESCAQSLLELRANESRILNGLGDRILAQFPEAGAKLRQAIDKEVDEIVGRLKGDS